jgi:phosphoribosylformylglycinamidine synthase
MGFDTETLERHGLTPEEYARIVALVGREPNLIELGLFSVMWSEHCSYKSSRVHLRSLPTEGPRRAGPGRKRGCVDRRRPRGGVQDRIAQPSVVHRAVSGRGDGRRRIIRDIFTMGARPIALLDSLRFGSLEDAHPADRQGVVAGIGGTATASAFRRSAAR